MKKKKLSPKDLKPQWGYYRTVIYTKPRKDGLIARIESK